MQREITWVLVADGQHARILENDGPGKGLRAVTPEVIEHPNPPTREQGTDRPGRVTESVGGARHAMEPRADWHREEKVAFAKELAARLERAVAAGLCQRLILVAPPRMLGDLREALSDRMRQLVVGEIAKDLTKANDADLAGHLDMLIAI